MKFLISNSVSLEVVDKKFYSPADYYSGGMDSLFLHTVACTGGAIKEEMEREGLKYYRSDFIPNRERNGEKLGGGLSKS